MHDSPPRLMLAAPASGGGKTTLALALLAALVRRGLRPAAFKCGPDYIDPMFHGFILDAPGRNLDLFFMSPEIARGLLRRGAATAGVSILEGVMGYYDGIGATAAASSWDLAATTMTPAVLALRPGGAFLSVAALVRGFLHFRENHMLRGAILNACGERLHARLAPVLERETGLRVYGYLPNLPGAALESRHLGLVTPDGVHDLREKTRLLAEQAEKTLDIDGLLELARSAAPIRDASPAPRPITAGRPRIAVARDAAFCFHYRENLELLEDLGAELIPFSPLSDAELPSACGGLYLGGGYPELHAGTLAANASMRRSIRDSAEAGLPVLAECGGFLYLQRELFDREGRAHPMVGLLPGAGRDAGRLGRFGYVTLRSDGDNLLCRDGEEIRAHEFHYWNSDAAGAGCVARKAGDAAEWRCAVTGPALFAGFPHIHFWSNPAAAERFVTAATRRI